MESVIQKAINWCFSDEIMKAIASEILLKKEKSSEKVESLQVQTIKSIMRLEIENDVDQKVFFNLIFRESINIHGIVDFIYPRDNLPISLISRELKSDPQIVFLILEQNLRKEMCNEVHITVGKSDLRIELNVDIFLQLAHPDGKEFDFGWAERFLKMAFSKRIFMVSMRMDGEHIHNKEYMRKCIEDTLNNLKVEPAEGWEEAIKKGTLPIYRRLADNVMDDHIYITHLIFEDEYFSSEDYYGYIQ